MRRGWPLAFAGMRIGLLGGSFDPAHSGHDHVAKTALARLGLDAVWWLATPQNPLKPQSGPLAARLASARRIARGRRHVVSDLETRVGTRFTIDTLRALRRHYPGVRFVFLMGADGMASFQRWRRWPVILRLVPIFVVSRPGAGVRERRAKPFAPARLRGADRGLLRARVPAWAFVAARFNPLSSSDLRARKD
ncbi:MAG: nicotinate-nucleotide adenylyltransferase [Caulobacterales bacterium]